MTDLDAGQAYRRLQQRARSERRGTEELLVLYAHEGFLRRLSLSSYRERLVLKGGMLLAVLDARRPTRDADLSVHGVPNDDASVRALVTGIAEIAAADGLTFDPTTITTRTMREDADYHGVRVTIPTAVATAKLKVQLDLSFGDPVDVCEIRYPALLDDRDIALLGYSLQLVLAEKLATMMSRGRANTRERDFADVVQLSRVQTIDAHALRRALRRTADHRKHPVSPLAEPLDGHAAARQAAWTALRRRSGLDALSPDFRDVVEEVVRFVDPLVGDDGQLERWMPDAGRWATAAEVEGAASANPDVRQG